MAIPLVKYHSEDPGLNLFQTNLQKTLAPLITNPLNSGVLLPDVVLATGTNQVAHLLGRPLLGWFVTRINAAQTIYDTQSTNKLPSEYLTLVSSGAVTVDLYVF